MEETYGMDVDVNTYSDDTQVAVYDCGDERPWQRKWFKIFVTGHCNIGDHQADELIVDTSLDHTGEVMSGIDQIEADTGGDED
jgi:hypothetical protein